MFYRDDFPAACIWPLAADGYRLVDDQIEPVSLDSWQPNAPLADPELFVSFVKLGARGRPSPTKCLRWVQSHGLLKRQDKDQGALIVKRHAAPRGPYEPEWWLAEPNAAFRAQQGRSPVVEESALNQAPVSLDDFRAEIHNARSALSLYELLRKEDLAGLRSRVNGAREREPHDVLSEVDKGLARIGDTAFEAPWTVGAIWRAALVLEDFVGRKVANVTLDFFTFPDKPVRAPAYSPVQSWSCPDLLSALYLQFYLWMVRAWPMRICANEPCSTPFPATRTDKIYCTDACRSAARDNR
jgi:hypothetical protein